jgi:hypothetical protein
MNICSLPNKRSMDMQTSAEQINDDVRIHLTLMMAHAVNWWRVKHAKTACRRARQSCKPTTIGNVVPRRHCEEDEKQQQEQPEDEAWPWML